jgi:ketol-acid reductoisomerase
MANPGETQIKVYRAEDAPQRGLTGEAVAVLGYGNLGRTAALNLRDSGATVRWQPEDEYAGRARDDSRWSLSVAASDDIVFLLLPTRSFLPSAGEVAPALRPGAIASRRGAAGPIHQSA